MRTEGPHGEHGEHGETRGNNREKIGAEVALARAMRLEFDLNQKRIRAWLLDRDPTYAVLE